MDRKYRILIVEDEEHIARLEATFLERCGYEVRICQDGLEALSTLRTWRPDLILADVMMPRLDGYRFCRMLKLDHKWRSIPLVLVTAKGATSARTASQEVGADGLLLKPFTLDSIRQCLARFLPDSLTEEPQLSPVTAGEEGEPFPREGAGPFPGEEAGPSPRPDRNPGSGASEPSGARGP